MFQNCIAGTKHDRRSTANHSRSNRVSFLKRRWIEEAFTWMMKNVERLPVSRFFQSVCESRRLVGGSKTKVR
jgi:hypothetical protein